jgi:hypothetical protein
MKSVASTKPACGAVVVCLGLIEERFVFQLFDQRCDALPDFDGYDREFDVIIALDKLNVGHSSAPARFDREHRNHRKRRAPAYKQVALVCTAQLDEKFSSYNSNPHKRSAYARSLPRGPRGWPVQ